MIRRKLTKHGGGAADVGSSAAASSPNLHGTNASKSGDGFRRQSVGLNLPYSTACRVVRFHLKKGDTVRMGHIVASCRNESNDEIVDLRSPADGTIDEILVQENDHFDGAVDYLVRIAYCLHDVKIDNMCAVCGLNVNERVLMAEIPADVSLHKQDTATVNVEGGLRLEVTRDAAFDVRESTVRRLFAIKKLNLVLDLDHTLLHCTDDPRAANIAQNAPPSANLHTFVLDGKMMVMKLRPGLIPFLQTMKSQYFEMSVYTAGTRAYAKKVCSIIDPDGSCIGERIVSRDETPDLGSDKKDLTRLFPVDDTMVVVVDDRDVWNGVANLLTCEPFIYFTGMHDVNNAGWRTMSGDEASDHTDSTAAVGGESSAQGGMPLKKSPYAEELVDPGLARVESILKQVHGKFYYPHDPVTLDRQLEGRGSDVKVILRGIKLHVLKKVVVAFDPEIMPRTAEVDPQKYLETLFAKARACGATLKDKVDSQTTHLVACGETELAKYGKQKGIWVVQPTWLEKSEHFWQRLKEEPFSVFRVYGSVKRLKSSAESSTIILNPSDSRDAEAQTSPVEGDQKEAQPTGDLEARSVVPIEPEAPRALEIPEDKEEIIETDKEFLENLISDM